MTGYGQFCAIARALEVLGERWTLLIVRELLMGERRFNDIHRGIPRMSRTMLSTRLKALEKAGVVARSGPSGAEYALTDAGAHLAPVLRELGGWATAWDRRGLGAEHLDPDALVWDIRRRVVPEHLPADPTLVELRFRPPPGAAASSAPPTPYFLLARRPEVQLCTEQGGFEVALQIDADLDALTRYWLGEHSWNHLLRTRSIHLTGPTRLRRAFPTWFSGYLLSAAAER